MIEFVEYDVFGEEIEKDHVLRDDFLEPPFSVLDTKTGSWRERVNAWKSKGIQGELGREGKDNMAFNFVGPSKEQVDADIQNAKKVLGDIEQPTYICGDSDKSLDDLDGKFDMVFSCPPYADLEVYSDLPGDISNMPYDKFLSSYRSIIKKSCEKLNRGGYAVFVVGDVRNPNTGGYIGFVPDTIKAFMDCGMLYYK